MRKKLHTITFNSAIYMLKTIFTMIFPLVTIPYVTRILGVNGYGKENFISSIISYFLLLASLGISSYGIREGVRVKDKKREFDSLVSELFTINIISTIVSYGIFLLFLLFSNKMREYAVLALILSIKILLQPMSLEWIYNVFEDYIFITIRTIVIQIFSVIYLFLWVTDKQDVYQYAMYLVISSVAINISNYIYSKKYCKIEIKFSKKILCHIVPIFILFFSSIASQIYVNADTTMIGFMKNDSEVGLYTAATNIYNMLRNILGALVTVFSTRLACEFVLNKEKYSRLFSKLFQSIIIFCIPISIGCIFLARDMILILNGNSYLEAGTSLRILACALNFSVIGSLFSTGVLIPSKQEKIILMATIVGAILNIGLNIVAIYRFGICGAAITTCISELIVMIIQIHYSSKYIKNIMNLSDLLKLLLAILSVVLICYVVDIFMEGWKKIIISFLTSTAVYFGVLAITRNSVIDEFISVHRKKHWGQTP